MSDIDERVAALLGSPLGCAFLLIAEASGLTPKEIADPVNSLYMGAYAARDIEVWRSDRYDVLQELFYQRGPRHADLAHALLEEPGTAWWFGPLNRDQQVWFPLQDLRQAGTIGSPGTPKLERQQQVWAALESTPPEPARMGTPANPPSAGERYAQQVMGAFLTSTLWEGTSSLLVAFDENLDDIGIGMRGLPFVPAWRLKAEASARVFEVDGPLAWHDLCVRYPAERTSIRPDPDFSEDEGRLVPNWWAVSADWDAVHLTFGGWLAAEQVRVESSAGWTYHWGWQAEQAMWLRWMFTETERLSDHERITSPLDGLIQWHIWFRDLHRGRRGRP